MGKENARTENMQCIVCGDPLVLPINKFHACSKCTPKLEKVVYETRMRSKVNRKRTDTQRIMNPRRIAVIGGIKEDDELLFMQ